MATSLVIHKKISAQSKEEVLALVGAVMDLAHWQDYVSGNKIFIKPNLISTQLVPGQCTSPWVLEGVIKKVRSVNPSAKILVGDTDVATSRQVESAAKLWGVIDVCKKYSASFVNLANDEFVPVHVGGRIFEYVQVPRSIHESDSLISVPVLKTHTVTVMTGALKNQWGCIPRFRHQFHPVTDWAIPEINKAVSPNFVVVDATISMEGDGPNIGMPKITNSVFASSDLVAMDAALARFIGLLPENVPYIKNAQNIGIGNMEYETVGDLIETHTFKLPNIRKTPFVYLEMKLRKVPGLSWFLFSTPFFYLPAFIASRYNSVWCYYTKGRYCAREILKHALYKQEFEPLMTNSKQGRHI